MAAGQVSPQAAAAILAAMGGAAAPATTKAATRKPLPNGVAAARKAARAAAGEAVEAALASNQLVAFATSIGCEVEATPSGRLGVRKYKLEAALHKAYGSEECADPSGHYLCGITEAIGRSPLADSQRVETVNDKGQVRASTWYFDRMGETGVRVGGYTKNRK